VLDAVVFMRAELMGRDIVEREMSLTTQFIADIRSLGESASELIMID
jgi:hypothetical protein